jgi:antitoxin (DNA-binding transcriptional repressor) of toxin-antitoxin stability system
MKAINVTELKAHLSKYLRMASRGTLFVAKDRDEPVAQLGPLGAEALS